LVIVSPGLPALGRVAVAPRGELKGRILAGRSRLGGHSRCVLFVVVIGTATAL